MKIILIDETGIPKTGFFGIAAVMVDATKYPVLATRYEATLNEASWRPEYEFKGKFVFSAKSGDPDVPVDRRIEMVTKLFNEFRSAKNSRIGAAVLAWNNEGDSLENYRLLLGHALRLLKLPKDGGKNLVTVVCDDWQTITFDDLSQVVRDAISDLKGRIIEDVVALPSRSRHAGLSIVDLLAYFLAWRNKKDEVEIFPGSKLPEKNARIAEWCESVDSVLTKEVAPGTPYKRQNRSARAPRRKKRGARVARRS